MVHQREGARMIDWVLFALGSAFFAGVTSILAKLGVKTVDSTLATAIRTVIVLLFSWAMVLLVGSFDQIGSIDAYTMTFLILSGLATGASWLCFFKALELGDVSKVVPIDKSSLVITVVLAALFLGEGISMLGAVGVLAIAIGTLAVADRKEPTEHSGHGWLFYAFGAAVFAAATSILGKVGIEGVESNLGTAIRTVVVLAMSWMMVFVTGKNRSLRSLPRRELGFIIASGFATGASWLCFYRALQDGPASVVVPLDKLSIVVTMVFSVLILGERINRRAFVGLVLIVAGTMLMLLRMSEKPFPNMFAIPLISPSARYLTQWSDSLPFYRGEGLE